MDGTLTGTTTTDQSGLRSNGSEGVLQISRGSRTGTSPSDGLVSYPGNSLAGDLPLCRVAVSVYYSPSRLGYGEIRDQRRNQNRPDHSTVEMAKIMRRVQRGGED